MQNTAFNSRNIRQIVQRACVAALVCGAVLVAACSPAPSTAATPAKPCTTGGTGSGPWGWSGDATQGFIPPSEPDVNCDGQVVIGILSPGDTNDHGFYESFVDTAKQFASANGWKVIVVDRINPADAVTQARDMCRQHVDMVAVAAGELKDALSVAQEDVCKDTLWYMGGGQVTQTPYFVTSQDNTYESGYASGFAAGELMQANGSTKAGYITGPALDFAKQFAQAFLAGIRSVVPNASLVTTYTGSFDDSGTAVEAMKAQESQGISIVYPYLGGATDAVAAEANRANIPVLTPGTDRCASDTPTYSISVIFNQGDYFAAALGPFKGGTLRVGLAHLWHMGQDPVPTVKICKPVGDQQTKLNDVMKQIGSGAINPQQLAQAINL